MVRVLSALFIVLMGSPQLASAQIAPLAVIKDCDLCPEMTVLPAGRFIMGADNERETYGPAHDRVIAKRFAIAKTEITFEQYEHCVRDDGCQGGKSDHGWGRGDQPVINVSWYDALDYAAWLTFKTGQRYRLPAEAEWEYAARGGTVSRFYWGDSVGSSHANCRQCGTPWSGKGAAPVAQFPANPFGLYDMLGNVSEWVAECWTDRLKTEATPMERDVLDGQCTARVTRGGDWYYVPSLATSAARKSNGAALWSYTIGFRVVREVE